MNRKFDALLPILLIGFTLVLSACATPTNAAPPMGKAASASAFASACDLPACSNLVITQDGQPGMLQAAASFTPSASLTQSPWKIDTGTPSPDGGWVAYTSISSESGGPVFMQNVKTAEWTNLIDALNTHLPSGQPPFAQDYSWDVIGWFPNSKSLMIGPLDLSQVVIVELGSFASQSIPFPGGGRGGRMFVNLAPNGQSFIFTADDSAGNQILNAYDIQSGAVSELLRVPYEQGVLSNPRYSPDQTQLAYMLQSGQPDSDLSYSIQLYSPQSGQTSLLVQDNLTMSVPLWSPDGQAIAFVRREGALAQPGSKEALPQEERTNVWVISVADGQQTQASFAEGFVRSPAWDKDSQTLAYVLGDGQVGLVNLAQPGKSWQAAAAGPVPELTNVFFLP
jgi:hypothetical protein